MNRLGKYLLAIILLFSLQKICMAQIGNGRTLFVETFGTNIFRVDESGGTIYTRQNDLISYCQANGITTIILNKLSAVSGTFSKTTVITSVNTTQEDIEADLGSFIIQAHAVGITTVGIQGSPQQAPQVGSLFFENVNQFNKRMKLTHGGQTNACFDMIYIESDWWNGDPLTNTPANRNLAWSNYFKPGMDALLLAKQRSDNLANGFFPLKSGTYIGNLATLSTFSANQIADIMDAEIDIFYIHLYLPAHARNYADLTDINPFFWLDDDNGQRLRNLAKNAEPTIVVPLFSAEASSDPASNFLGDNLVNTNGYIFSQVNITSYTLDAIKSRYESDFNLIDNPYNEAAGSPDEFNTMAEITTTSSTTTPPNDITFGVGWFKYGCMPDAKYYIFLPNDDLNVNTIIDPKIQTGC